MKIFLAAIFSIVIAGCASVPRGDSDLKVIDVHTHTVFTGGVDPDSGNQMDEVGLLSELKSVNAVAAIALTIPMGVIPIVKTENEVDLRSMNVFRCAGVTGQVDSAALEHGLKSGFYKCIKIYLGYVHQYAYDARYEPVYRLAEKYDLAVVFHTGDTLSHVSLLKYADPLTIDEVATRHPKVRFVIAHCGNPWIESAAEVAYKNPNVYLDGSAFMLGDLDKQPDEKVETYVVKPLRWVFNYVDDPKKLMYGTDWPWAKMAPYLRAFKRAIPKEHWQAVFHDNAVRVFKIELSGR